MTDRWMQWCQTCRAYRQAHDHAEAPSLFDAEPKAVAVKDTRAATIRRNDGPMTSQLAAEKIAPRTGTQKARLLEIYRASAVPLTDDEAGERIGLQPMSARKRCADLRNDGLIEPVDVVEGSHGTRVRRCKAVA